MGQQTPHWIPRPVCNEKTDVKIYADTVLLNYPLLCPHCQKETIINVFQLKMESVVKTKLENS